MAQEKLVMSVADVQHALGIGKNRAYRLFKQRSFPSFMIDGTYMIRIADFERWLERIQKLPDKNYRLDQIVNP